MNKSNFKVGKKVYIEGTDQPIYMYSFDSDDRYVVCTPDAHGHGVKTTRLYTSLKSKPNEVVVQDKKNFKHSVDVVKVFRDVEALVNLLKDNPTYKDTIIELMRPYVGNARFWDFVLYTAADNPLLHKSIQMTLINSKLQTNE